jgi:hypothetical protein
MRSTIARRLDVAGLCALAAVLLGLTAGARSATAAGPELQRLVAGPVAVTTPLPSPTRLIGVVFVVVHRGGEGLLSRDQLAARLAELERDWAPAGVRFVLADTLAVEASEWFRLAPGSARERAAMRAVTDAGYGAARYLRIFTGEPVDEDGDELPGYAVAAGWEGGHADADGVVLSWRLLADATPASRQAAARVLAGWLGSAPPRQATALDRLAGQH